MSGSIINFAKSLCSFGIKRLGIKHNVSVSRKIPENFSKEDVLFEEPRREIKFFFQSRELSCLRTFVRTHPAGFQVAYKPRFVNNLYFDREDLGS